MRAALLHFCFEDYTIELANALAEFVDLTLIQPHKVAQACEGMLDPRIQVRQFYKPRIRDPRNFFAMVEMMRIIRDLRPDLLHVQETNDFWYDLTLLFNRMPPLITTIHDIFRHPGDRQTAPGAEYTRLIGLYRSQQVIVHTQNIQKILIDQFRLPPQRVKVLAHGELGSLYRRRSQAVAPLAPSARREPHTLLFFGRIWPYKGLKYLLQAMPLVAEQIPDVKLIIAGRGEELQQYFPQGSDANRYEIHNEFIPVEAVADLFQRSAVTVLPYIEASQSGVAALSYGMGTPVIASNLNGLGEMVRHGQDGLLVPPRDVAALAAALVQVLSRPDLQSQMQAAALERCRQDLNWRTIAAQTAELYYQVSGLSRPSVAQVQGC